MDLLVCALETPFSSAAKVGVSVFANSLFGMVSLISSVMLSHKQYHTTGLARTDATNYTKAPIGMASSRVFLLVWTPPLFFGWSCCSLDSPGTTCSVCWMAKNISYIICPCISYVLASEPRRCHVVSFCTASSRKSSKTDLEFENDPSYTQDVLGLCWSVRCSHEPPASKADPAHKAPLCLDANQSAALSSWVDW
ncbi:teleost multiple tissue opsin a [Brachyhypopomus gauderio]|uniref:teleost multiple tissue opsin a n=1 Tax=Brachyhypopomus gauderio TaxID=698409 RepID=UPI0040435E97